MKRALELSLAISLALGVGNAWAVGLGQIQVKSRLNQPLVAEIPVTVDRGSDAETLSVSLASAEEFARIGIERSQIGVPLEFVISKSAGGQTVIRVTSTEPVRAPFLDFLIAANWSNGRVLREYTVLLDPPSMAPAVAAIPAPVAVPSRPAIAPPPPPPPREVAKATPPPAAVEPARPAPKPAVEDAPKPRPAEPVVAEVAPMPKPVAEPVSRPEPAPAAETVAMPVESKPVAVAPAPRALPASKPLPPSVAASNGTNYGPVAAGETLWEIANATLPDDGVSANQLMLALLKANPQAFSRNNINRLKRGAILRIPSAEDIRAVGSMREATAQVRSQIADWRQQNNAPTLLAGTAAANVGKPESSSTPSSKAVDDRLALVPPEMGKDGLASTGQAGSSAGASGGNASAAELARANESLASVRQEAGELKSRVQDLEDLKSKNDRLISLKNSEIADLQRKLAAVQSGTTPAAVSAPSPEVMAADPEATAPPEAASAPSTEAKDDIWGSTPADSAAASETPPVAAALDGNIDSTVAPTVPVDGAPVSEVGDTTVANTAPVAAAVTEPTGDVDNAGDSVATEAVAPVATDVDQVDAENPWYLDPRILGGAGIIILLLGILALRARRKSGPVSGRPSIAEKFGSDMAVAGALAQGADGVVMLDEEGQLVEQIAEQPDDLGARLELLSIYYADNRVDEFRAGALAMEPYVDDPSEAEWVQVRAMGEDLMPHDPLFSSAVAGETVAESDVADEWSSHDEVVTDPDLRWSDDGEDEVRIGDTEDEHVVTPAVVGSDDVSRYAPAAIVAAPVIAAPDDSSDFAGFDEYVEPVRVVPQAAEADSDLGLDFNLDDDAEPEKPALSPVSPEPRDSIDVTKARTLTESSNEAKTNDDSFEFDLPPLDFDSEFSKPEIIEPAVVSDAEVGEDLDEEFLIGEDALGTKIDLARAYADMGDPDGARGMLEEVISEGDAEQQEQARKLLEELR